MRDKLTYANVMATFAVFIALGGTSYAAIALSRNSVRTQHIAPGAVTGSDIRDGAVRNTEIAVSAVTGTEIRDNSVTADDLEGGGLGEPVGYAYVAGGNVVAARSQEIAAGNVRVAEDAAGPVFCIVSLPFSPKVVIATLGPEGPVLSTSIHAELGGSSPCPAGTAAVVRIRNRQGYSVTNTNFTLVFF